MLPTCVVLSKTINRCMVVRCTQNIMEWIKYCVSTLLQWLLKTNCAKWLARSVTCNRAQCCLYIKTIHLYKNGQSVYIKTTHLYKHDQSVCLQLSLTVLVLISLSKACLSWLSGKVAFLDGGIVTIHWYGLPRLRYGNHNRQTVLLSLDNIGNHTGLVVLLLWGKVYES